MHASVASIFDAPASWQPRRDWYRRVCRRGDCCAPRTEASRSGAERLRMGAPSRPSRQVGSPAPTVPDQATSPAVPPLYQLSGGCEPSVRISCRPIPDVPSERDKLTTGKTVRVSRARWGYFPSSTGARLACMIGPCRSGLAGAASQFVPRAKSRGPGTHGAARHRRTARARPPCSAPWSRLTEARLPEACGACNSSPTR